MKKPILTYFFEAEYEDGSIYTQNKDDASVKFPPIRDENGDLQGKSCFTDVLDDIKHKKLVKFSLIGKGNRITVNLANGLFTINGLQVLLESIKLPILPEFEIVYYRQRSEDQNLTFSNKTGELLDETITGSFIEYFIGWKCMIAGKEYQQKIAVA